ncbi:aminotransferase [Peribacillus deserti]|uniref:Aminotransferase n=1 Tax=Peribacillus deserti TaxID=673318 RepID=A0ABS2QN82_9BACI|nr:aminotransferase A [Peribacillus deserti]MBM7694625.1 aminotransferase [Peribacillus deserti]
MEEYLNSRVTNLELSGIRKFFNMVAEYDDVVSLTIGQPDFPTPLHIKEAAKQAIDENFTVYTHNAGFLELRQAAAQYLYKKYNVSYEAETEIIVTTGASQAIDISLRTLLSEGDEVILPGPVYPGYEPIVKLCGATPVLADITKSSFKMNAEIISSYITEKTKCIILPYPSNPTGVTLSKDELREIAELVKGKGIFILADEIYSELVFDQKHTSIAEFLKEQTILINGLSKSHSMTGWRIGFLYAPKDIARHILKVHQYNVSCASSISQKAAYAAVTAGFDDAAAMREEYKKRREFVYNRLVEMKLEVVKPDGAFYFFIKLPEAYSSSLDFALELLKTQRVALVPGDAFSIMGEGYVRLSYAYSMETLKKALDRLQLFLKK